DALHRIHHDDHRCADHTKDHTYTCLRTGYDAHVNDILGGLPPGRVSLPAAVLPGDHAARTRLRTFTRRMLAEKQAHPVAGSLFKEVAKRDCSVSKSAAKEPGRGVRNTKAADPGGVPERLARQRLLRLQSVGSVFFVTPGHGDRALRLRTTVCVCLGARLGLSGA